MKLKKFEVIIAIPEDKDPEYININSIAETLRINNCDFGAEDCCIEVKEVANEN